MKEASIVRILSNRKAKIEVRVKGLLDKINPLNSELIRITKALNLLNGSTTNGTVNGNSLAKETVVEVDQSEGMTIADIVRLFTKNAINGVNTIKLRDMCKLTYPKRFNQFSIQLGSALFFLVKNGELNKFGQGSEAVYKPVSKEQ